ncbi:RNA-binding ATPase activator esf2 [Irineochytrium annulatum]|nr:RNA-binding ATPase activator esf2 [Irineochytrium annulatum]
MPKRKQSHREPEPEEIDDGEVSSQDGPSDDEEDDRFCGMTDSRFQLEDGADDDDAVVVEGKDEDGAGDDDAEGDEYDDYDPEADDDDDEPNLLPSDQPNILNLPTASSKPSKAQGPLTLKSIATHNTRVDNSGVVYLSRLPPFLQPRAIRQLLSSHGARIGRLYLSPEDPRVAARRKKYRGNKRVNYTEGWVEFEDKRQARRVAEMLNTRPMGEVAGKRGGRSWFKEDLWSIKYLPRFKWGMLTEQIAYEKAVRDQKLRTEMESVKRENKAYIKNVERAKMIEAIEEKKRKRQKKLEEEGGEDGPKAKPLVKPAPSNGKDAKGAKEKVGRQFKQRAVKDPVVDRKAREGAGGGVSGAKKSVLSKIFG